MRTTSGISRSARLACLSLATRVGQAATERCYAGASDPELAFTFGLQRVLDGIEVLVGETIAKRRSFGP